MIREILSEDRKGNISADSKQREAGIGWPSASRELLLR